MGFLTRVRDGVRSMLPGSSPVQAKEMKLRTGLTYYPSWPDFLVVEAEDDQKLPYLKLFPISPRIFEKMMHAHVYNNVMPGSALFVSDSKTLTLSGQVVEAISFAACQALFHTDNRNPANPLYFTYTLEAPTKNFLEGLLEDQLFRYGHAFWRHYGDNVMELVVDTADKHKFALSNRENYRRFLRAMKAIRAAYFRPDHGADLRGFNISTHPDFFIKPSEFYPGVYVLYPCSKYSLDFFHSKSLNISWPIVFSDTGHAFLHDKGATVPCINKQRVIASLQGLPVTVNMRMAAATIVSGYGSVDPSHYLHEEELAHPMGKHFYHGGNFPNGIEGIAFILMTFLQYKRDRVLAEHGGGQRRIESGSASK